MAPQPSEPHPEAELCVRDGLSPTYVHLPFCPPSETLILSEPAGCPAKIIAFWGGLSFICDTVLVQEI